MYMYMLGEGTKEDAAYLATRRGAALGAIFHRVLCGVCACVCVCVCVCVCTYVCIHSVCVYIYMYTLTHTHTHTH